MATSVAEPSPPTLEGRSGAITQVSFRPSKFCNTALGDSIKTAKVPSF